MFSVGDKIMYKCMEGFIADDTKPMTSVCLENGTWSKIDTNCFPGLYGNYGSHNILNS